VTKRVIATRDTVEDVEYTYDVEELRQLFELMVSIKASKVRLEHYMADSSEPCNSPLCMAGHAAVHRLLPSLNPVVRIWTNGKSMLLPNNDLKVMPRWSGFQVEADNISLVIIDPDMFDTNSRSGIDRELYQRKSQVTSKELALYRILRAAGYKPGVAVQHVIRGNRVWPTQAAEPRKVIYTRKRT